MTNETAATTGRTTKIVRAALIVMAVVYLFAFAGDGLRAPLTGDDLMNTYQYWSRPLGEVIKESLLFFPAEIARPLGALFYSPLFALFGLNPLPYRIVCLSLLLGNLALLYVFCFRLSRSREVGVVACLIGAYHAHLGDLYYNSGTIYDLLCFTFYYLALIYYFRIRDRGTYPGAWQSVALLTLYIAALDAKEMAVTLPVLLVAYELLYHPPKAALLRIWIVREGRFLWLTVPVTIAYILSRIAGPHRVTTNPAYYPHISLNAFMTGWRHYINYLFYNSIQFGRTWIIILWIALLMVAWIARRRELLFAWLTIMVGVLPVIFIEPRGLYAIYMTLPGWYLFAAVLVVRLRDLLIRYSHIALSAFQIDARQLALFLVVLLFMIPVHRNQKLYAPVAPAAKDPARLVYEHLVAKRPPMPPGAAILFLSDPFEPYDYTLTFLFRLHYHDKEIRVDRVKFLGAEPDAEAKKEYQHIFTFAGGTVTEIR